jgi:hypothetical protein
VPNSIFEVELCNSNATYRAFSADGYACIYLAQNVGHMLLLDSETCKKIIDWSLEEGLTPGNVFNHKEGEKSLRITAWSLWSQQLVISQNPLQNLSFYALALSKKVQNPLRDLKSYALALSEKIRRGDKI